MSATSDLVLFAITAVLAVAFQKHKGSSNAQAAATCDANDDPASTTTTAPSLKNSAFVFVKPHANTAAARDMVRSKLLDAGLNIVSESDISGAEIDEKKLIDQHYYAIASKATILPASEIPVPADKFEESFGEKWSKVIAEKRAVNAMEACERFKCDASALNEAWGASKKVVKFGGGFYCGLVSVGGQSPLYVFNAFFMSMRSKFVAKGSYIHCYEVEWSPCCLSWSSFRNELLGPTDPAEAPEGSIRRTILDQYKELGLSSIPNKSDNGVHASASPFEGLAEKNNWLNRKVADDTFGKALLNGGLSMEMIEEWSKDPRVELPQGGMGSVFDATEDLDVVPCLEKLIELSKLNADVV